MYFQFCGRLINEPSVQQRVANLKFMIFKWPLLEFIHSVFVVWISLTSTVLEMSQSEIEEELYKEALRQASSESKHSKR